MVNVDVEYLFDPGLSRRRQLVTTVIESSWIESRVFYLVFIVVASEPHLSKVQQQHLLWVSQPYSLIPLRTL